jgi:hypothetical protein
MITDMDALRELPRPALLAGHPRRRALLLASLLTLPVSLFYVAAWRLDPDDGFTVIGLFFVSLYLFAYLPWVVWLAYRVCGLSLGWLAGLGVTVSYLAGVVLWGWAMTDSALAPVLWVALPVAVLTVTVRFARLLPRRSTVWPRVVLAVVAAPVTAYAGFLAILYAVDPFTSS